MGIFNFNLIRKTLDDIEEKTFQLSRQIEQKKQEKEKLLRQPSSKQDVIDMVNGFIDGQADEYKDRLSHILKRFIENPENIKTSSSRFKGNGLRLLSFTNKEAGASNDSFHDAQPNMFFIFRDQIKSSIHESIMDMDWPNSGLSLKQREDEAAKLDKEIGKLQKELTDVLKSARDSGLDI